MSAEQEMKKLSLLLTGIFYRMKTNKLSASSAFEEVNDITDKMDAIMENVSRNSKRQNLNNQDLHQKNYKLKESNVNLEKQILKLEKENEDLAKENCQLKEKIRSLEEWSAVDDASMLNITVDSDDAQSHETAALQITSGKQGQKDDVVDP